MNYTNIKYIAQGIIEMRALIGWGVRWLVEAALIGWGLRIFNNYSLKANWCEYCWVILEKKSKG